VIFREEVTIGVLEMLIVIFRRLLFIRGVKEYVGDDDTTFLYPIGRFEGLGGGCFTANASRVLDKG
jgi:hypothetical protein